MPKRENGPADKKGTLGNKQSGSQKKSDRTSKPRGSAGALLFRLFSYLRHYRFLLFAVLSVSVLTALLDLFAPWMIRLAVDRIMGSNEESKLVWIAVALMAMAVVHGTADFFRLYLTAQLGQRVVFRIRTALFAQLSRLSFSFYDAARTGDLVIRTTADVDALSQFFGRSAVIILTNVLFLLGILAVLLTWDWMLAIAYLVLLPFIVLGMFAYARRVRPAMGQVRRVLSKLTSHLENTLVGILIVKVLGREQFEKKRFDRVNAAYRNASLKTIRITSLWMPIADVIMGLGAALVLLSGGYGVIRGTVSLGTLIAFTVYIGMLLRPIRQTGMMLSTTMQALAAAERVFEVLDTRPEIQDLPEAVDLPVKEGCIEFRDVDFSYAGGQSVLKNVSFRAESGEMVALVGPSGAGKSTIVHLLLRFYDAQGGQILIDGTDIRNVTLKSLRNTIGIAMQNVFIFDTTIGENIAYGNPDATRQDIERVAGLVQLQEFISTLPIGYETPVGEQGFELSGGQRQRIALARVLLRDPAILVLDEPTSSLDSKTERAMEAALEAAQKGRTTFVIAHRLWTVHHADKIIVLDNGALVEFGTSNVEETAHMSLMRRKGLYRKLYDLQFRTETQSGTNEGGR